MAKLSDTAQLDVANKLTLGIASTSSDKNYFEESFPWTPTVIASEIWADNVPFAATPAEADAVSSGVGTSNPTEAIVEKLTMVTMDEVPLSNGQAWAVYEVPGTPTSDTRITDWLNPQIFGSGYFFSLFENDDTPIALTDGRYQVDSKNGIVRFDEGFTPSDLGLLTPLKITFYRYDGRKGVFAGSSDASTCSIPHQEIVSFTDISITDGNGIVGSVSFEVANVDAFKLFHNKLLMVQGQDYDLSGINNNDIVWLVENHGVSLESSEDQLIACYSEACESLPLIPRQQELTPQDVGPTDGDVILTDSLDTPVFNPESVRIYHNKLVQVQGSGRDYSLTGPGFTKIIWQVEGGGSGTAQPLAAEDELVAHFLQDADTAVGPTGATGPAGPTGSFANGVLDDLIDVEAAGTFEPSNGDLLGFIGSGTSGFWAPVLPPTDQDLGFTLATGNTTDGSDIIISSGDGVDAISVLLIGATSASSIVIGSGNNLVNFPTGTIVTGLARIKNGTAITSTDTADSGERVLYDPSGGTFTINAPASPTIGDHWAVKNVTSDVTTITINGNGNNIEDPTVSFSPAASFSLSGDGISIEWEFDGVQWLVI